MGQKGLEFYHDGLNGTANHYFPVMNIFYNLTFIESVFDTYLI